MRDFIDIIAESLAIPYPIHWEQQSVARWYGTFSADDTEYFVSCYRIDGFDHPDEAGQAAFMRSRREGEWYDLAFSLSDDGLAGTRVIGTDGKQFRIFATVIAGIREFLHEVGPELIMLSASKENHNRLPLYQRMAKRFSAEMAALGYLPVPAPDHQYADVRAVADTLAWRKVK